MKFLKLTILQKSNQADYKTGEAGLLLKDPYIEVPIYVDPTEIQFIRGVIQDEVGNAVFKLKGQAAVLFAVKETMEEIHEKIDALYGLNLSKEDQAYLKQMGVA